MTTLHVVDVAAYVRLIQSLRRTSGARAISALDDALGRIYRGPSEAERNAQGETLARDLYRDGVRSYERRRTHEVLGPVERALDDASLASWATEVDLAVLVIRRMAERLPGRLRVALALRLRGLIDETSTQQHLGVNPRRARQLAAEAQELLLGDPEVVAAYETLRDGIGAERQESVERMLEEVFLNLADASSGLS